MIKLIKAIINKNESAAYTELANVKWNDTKVKHHTQLGRPLHALQSILCGLYLIRLPLFCFFWHPIFPNIAPTWATDKLARFPRWYKVLTWKLNKRFN